MAVYFHRFQADSDLYRHLDIYNISWELTFCPILLFTRSLTSLNTCPLVFGDWSDVFFSLYDIRYVYAYTIPSILIVLR